MRPLKIKKSDLKKIVKEEYKSIKRFKELSELDRDLEYLFERFEEGEDVSEEELNEFMAGLSSLGRWGQKKASDALGKWNQDLKTASDKALDSVRGFASDVSHQYKKGQRAADINRQRAKVDKEQIANNKKVQDLAIKGKEVNDIIRNYQNRLSQISKEYERLTGKEYVPGRAVANAKRYINEDFDHYSALSAAEEDGYQSLKRFFKPIGGYDFDFAELHNKGNFTWETEKCGDVFCSLEKGNVWTVTCRTEDDYFGTNSTYDFDETGLVHNTLSALRDLKKDVEETFVN